jgi:putative CocE/NonD family hydrolase
MYIKFILGCLLLASFSSYSQTKQELPENYNDKFSYQLPLDLNVNDSLLLADQMRKIALSINDFDRTTSDKYILDPTQKASIHQSNTYSFLVMNKLKEAMIEIGVYNNLKPSPAYSTPFGLFYEAYTQASSKYAPSENDFRAALKENVKERLNKLPADFRADIANSTKARYNESSPKNLRAILVNNILQAQKLSSSKLSYNSASSLLFIYSEYSMLAKNWKSIQQALYEVSPAKIEETKQNIPMKDGLRLNAFVYRDIANSEKVPAIVSLSPYPTGFEGVRGNVFASNGYVYVYVDNRGRGSSEGDFFPYEHDASDFYDIIDWVSKQPWCNGKVATSGGSYLGFAQWQTLRKEFKHPALKAVNPMVSVGFGIDFPRTFNTFYPYILRWSMFVSGKESNQALFADSKFWNEKYYALYKNRIPFAKLDSVVGLTNPAFKKWISHPDLDSYWKGILPSKEDYEAIDIPLLTTTGYYDADQLGAFYYFDNHQLYGNEKAKANHYMLIGPYDHGGAQWQPRSLQAGIDIEKEAQIPLNKYVIWWFDWVLKGKEKPNFLKDKINYFVTGTGKWKAAPSLSAATEDTLSLYLSPVGLKNSKRKDLLLLDNALSKSSEEINYSHDIASALDSAVLYNLLNTTTSYTSYDADKVPYLKAPHNLVFESKPLENDIIITDKIIPRLYISMNVPDGDFGVYLYEITPDGKSNHLCFSHVRSRYRNGGSNPQLMKPGQIELFSFNDNFIYIKKVSKGSKLRMTFESVNSPEHEKNFGFGGVVSQESTKKPRIIKATIHTGKNYPSRIDIPFSYYQSEGAVSTKEK